MLILTGVTISLLLEEDGIINKAKQARIEQRKAEAAEIAELYDLERYIETGEKLPNQTKETLVKAIANADVEMKQLKIYENLYNIEQNETNKNNDLQELFVLYRMDKTTDEEQEKLEEIGVKPLLGDIDLDGQLTEKDSELILEYDAWMEIRETATPIQIKIADINGDGLVDGNDESVVDQIVKGTLAYEGGTV